MPFPLPFVPQESYQKPVGRSVHHSRWFGASREGGKRKHAGCDLIAPEGTEIYAIDDGVVFEVAQRFYHGTGAIALIHTGGYVARYCEVQPASLAGVKKGKVFKAGEVVAKVGKMYSSAMLHFELYAGSSPGPLTNKASKDSFMRRADLMDPTGFLNRLQPHISKSHGPIAVNSSFAR